MEGFRLALERIDFNHPTHQLILESDFVNISSLVIVNDTDITELMKHIGMWMESSVAVMDVTEASPPVILPFVLAINSNSS